MTEWTVEELVDSAQTYDDIAHRCRFEDESHWITACGARKLAFDARRWAQQKVMSDD